MSEIAPEQRQAFLDLFRENTTQLTPFPLSTVQRQRDFLYRFYELDEPSIFEAVQAVWAQLNPPKGY